uniref:Dynein regulatory complex protein 12 n=1 Tax=Dunaliella tertiolecta TaxID=3047 RepID=A0A7S3VK31_DUNTE
MPPKAKGKKDVAAKLSDRENLGRAETEILSLQRLLELRSHEAVEARRSERLWRERMEGFKGAYAKQEEDTSDIKADMFRQYKTMQEVLFHPGSGASCRA